MPHRDLNVLDAAELAAKRIQLLLDAKKGRLLYRTQIQDAAGGIPANITEGFGRKTRADRDYKLGVARGEADETISRLRTNYEVGRISKRQFDPIFNLLVTIVKMLDSLIGRPVF
jgi:four helix bundle protein